MKGGSGYHVLYIFDMMKKIVHVMDPKRAHYNVVELERKHTGCIDRLLFALCKCIETFFDGWHVREDEFTRKVHRMMHEPSSSNDSTFYNIHCIWWFDGEYMQKEIWQDQLTPFRQQLMR
uniref:Uncharacterized protein n=1 Tax=Triticum urartu TaxID=4572 RepID=A0A8R7PZ31_TRIUA